MTLSSLLLVHQPQIEKWFQAKEPYTPLIYSSIDLRNAGFKIAPVDTNVFPSGFNNLNPKTYPVCIRALTETLLHYPLPTRKILLIPENHTRNPFYFENLFVLTELIHKAGYEVKIGSLLDLKEPKHIELAFGKQLTLNPLIRVENTLSLKNFKPSAILLNHDLSEGAPSILQTLTQPIIPPIGMGWWNRTKTHHFTIYNQLATELAETLNLDPWLLTPLFNTCENLSFSDQNHLGIQQQLMPIVAVLFEKLHQKYHQYHITEKPFIVIKSDTGTYGMAVMMIHSVDELVALNRKQRLKMSIGKGKQTVSRVLIQEGIPTIEYANQWVSESVLYSIGKTVVGGFYRVHKEKGPTDNLNAPGMHFEAMENIPYSYQVIARLTQLAASLERTPGNHHV